jgi:hypothetical protein
MYLWYSYIAPTGDFPWLGGNLLETAPLVPMSIQGDGKVFALVCLSSPWRLSAHGDCFVTCMQSLKAPLLASEGASELLEFSSSGKPTTARAPAPITTVKFSELFRFATTADKALLVLAAMSAMASGVLQVRHGVPGCVGGARNGLPWAQPHGTHSGVHRSVSHPWPLC